MFRLVRVRANGLALVPCPRVPFEGWRVRTACGPCRHGLGERVCSPLPSQGLVAAGRMGYVPAFDHVSLLRTVCRSLRMLVVGIEPPGRPRAGRPWPAAAAPQPCLRGAAPGCVVVIQRSGPVCLGLASSLVQGTVSAGPPRLMLREPSRSEGRRRAVPPCATACRRCPQKALACRSDVRMCRTPGDSAPDVRSGARQHGGVLGHALSGGALR